MMLTRQAEAHIADAERMLLFSERVAASTTRGLLDQIEADRTRTAQIVELVERWASGTTNDAAGTLWVISKVLRP